MKLIAIVAHDKNLLIGDRGNLPWNLPEDLQNFKNCTSGHAIVMGGTTFLSIGRPLPNRRNIVLSTTLKPQLGIEIFSSIPSCLRAFGKSDELVFVIGGSRVYGQFLEQNLLDEIWVSEVPGEFTWDAYFPEYRNAYELVDVQKFDTFDFKKYQRIK